jgi:hypothetical protein
VEAIRFLETLLLPDGRRAQDSALDLHGTTFGRLCGSLRAQARYGARRMPPAVGARAREVTERLLAALADANQRYLFGEGAERETAVRDLSRLAAGALRHSCRPRARRDSLVIIDAVLLADTPEPDMGAAEGEPLRSRLLAGAGRLAVAAGLLAGAFLFPGGGAAADLLGVAGVATIALVCPPVRDALQRAREFFVGGSPVERTPVAAEEEPSRPASPSPGSCPRCSDHSSVTAGSRPVG